MVQTRFYDPTFMGQYRSDTGGYTGGGTPIRVAGGEGYNSFLGFPSAIRDDMRSSKIKTTMRLSLYVTDGAEFDIGRHKETYDKKTNGLPWYEYTGLHPVLSTGRQKIDITSFNDEYRDKGFQGLVLYGARGANFGSAYGLTGDDFRVVIEMDGEWTDPPTAPVLLYPLGGETLSGFVTFRAEPSTDPDTPSANLIYQWGIYDGNVWRYYDTPPGQTNLTIDMSQLNETSTASVSVRAFDGENYSPWTNSAAVFTIRRNVAPGTPSNLKPSGGQSVDRTEVIIFSWTHNDTDSQSRFILRYRLRGATAWNTVDKITPFMFHYLGANTLPNGVIEWQVKTYDQMDLESPWSSINIFNAVEPTNAPTILRPTEGDFITEARPFVQWSSTEQTAYRLQVLQGSTVLDEIEKTSVNKAQTIGIDLENNEMYTFRVQVKGVSGIWSDWSSANVTTAFTPPIDPYLDFAVDQERGSIILTIENFASTDLQVIPNATYNELFRRQQGAQEWTRIAGNMATNSSYTDYTPGGGIVYEYKARAWAENGTYSESQPITIAVQINHVILSLAANPGEWIALKKDASKSFSYGVDRALMDFQGREYTSAEFGTNKSLGLTLSFTVWSREELNQLIRIAQSAQAILYRDRRGRREFISVDGVSVTDENPDFFSVSLSNPVKINFVEEVGQ